MNKYSFKDILEKKISILNEKNEEDEIFFDKIEIPKIQRDYAQGRLQESEIRKRFLNNIFKILSNNSDESMEMDFVYGSVDRKKSIFTPLDGQQRLTTLFLLHWYIGTQELEKTEKDKLYCLLGKFTYETRTSSRRFCENLNEADDVIAFNDYPSKTITNLPWFYRSYKQDPTIKSMLNMLDAIHDKYIVENKKMFDKLQRLQFYILPLNGFNLTDELYVKMNARGRQLTYLETFKADLIKWMKDDNNIERVSFYNEVELNNRSMPYYLSFSQKIDTIWTHFFWQETKNYDLKEKDKKGNLIHTEGKIIDTLFFQLFYRYYFSKLVLEESTFISNIISTLSENELNEKYKSFVIKNNKYPPLPITSGLKNELNNNPFIRQEFARYIYEQYCDLLYNEGKYQNFEVFQKVTSYDMLLKFEKLMDVLQKYQLEIFESIQPSWQGENKKYIFLKDITQSERVIFLSIVLFLEKDGDFNNFKFKQWMRVVWNIVENTDIDSYAPMISAMKLIAELSEKSAYSENIYSFLVADNSEPTSSKNAILEERKKAKFIITDNAEENSNVWENLFIAAEKHPFFKGSVGFIMTEDMTKEDFIHRTKIAFSVFDNKGVNNKYGNDEHIFLRALISKYTKSEQIINKNFTDVDEKEHYLKKMLASDEIVRNATAEWFSLKNESELESALIESINKNSEIQGWCNNSDWERISIQRTHEALYKTPDLQKWMQQKEAIRCAWRDNHLYVSKPRAWYDWIMLETNRNKVVSYLLSIGFTTGQQATYHKNEEDIPIPYFWGHVLEVRGQISGHMLRLTFDVDNFLKVELNAKNGKWIEIKSYNYIEEDNKLIDKLKNEILDENSLSSLIENAILNNNPLSPPATDVKEGTFIQE